MRMISDILFAGSLGVHRAMFIVGFSVPVFEVQFCLSLAKCDRKIGIPGPFPNSSDLFLSEFFFCSIPGSHIWFKNEMHIIPH